VLVFAILFVGFFYGVVPYFLSGITTTRRFHFRDPDDGKTPQSFGMAYHAIEFGSPDGIALQGWYVPAETGGGTKPRGTVILCHGHNRTRVEMLAEAQFAHQLGYDALLFDFRHQGASAGNLTSVGYWERLDMEAAARYALKQEHAEPPVIAWGISMGAAAALMAAAEDPRISAVISDSTFLSWDDVVRHHYRLFLNLIRRRWWWFPPLPAFPLADEVIYFAAWRAHFKPADFDLGAAVQRIGDRPILFVAVEGDPRMPPEIAQKLYAIARSPKKQIVILPGTRHGEGFNTAGQQYKQAVKDFLDKVGSGGFMPTQTGR
jgi:alpha-beta hydrolase superfamily lysophospholipase